MPVRCCRCPVIQNNIREIVVRKFVARIFVLIGVLGLTACAGTDFVRMPDNSLQLGKTTSQEVTARLGKPYQQGVLMTNGLSLQTYSYAYASTGGEPEAKGVTAARSQGFYFLNSILVGYEFTSSWKIDSSDFDGSKASQITKGTTTRDQVHML